MIHDSHVKSFDCHAFASTFITPNSCISTRTTRGGHTPTHAVAHLMSLSSRLANLSYAQLLEIAVDLCESSPELKNKADALIAKVAPLPSWCVDVLLSPDLLPQLFSSLGLSEHAAAGVCTPPGRVPTAGSCGGVATSTRGVCGSWLMRPRDRVASACCPAACWQSPRAASPTTA